MPQGQLFNFFIQFRSKSSLVKLCLAFAALCANQQTVQSLGKIWPHCYNPDQGRPKFVHTACLPACLPACLSLHRHLREWHF
jgi:hypothetical protein